MRPAAPYAKYIDEGDILYIRLIDAKIARTREGRSVWINVDYAADERVVAVEIVNASADHDLDHVPHREELARLIALAGLPFRIDGSRLRRLTPAG